MKILAINPGHNGSVCLLEDGKIIYYIEEERLSREKYDGNPFRSCIIGLLKHKIDIVILGGTSRGYYPQLAWTAIDPFTSLIRKFNKETKVIDMTDNHHLGHAAGAFYNSGFDEALSIVVDGCGSQKGARYGTNFYHGFETETIYKFSYDGHNELIYQSIFDPSPEKELAKTTSLTAGAGITITKAYEAVTSFLGWHPIEAGKTMGLAPYGEKDENIHDFFDQTTGRAFTSMFVPQYPGGALINTFEDVGITEYLKNANPGDQTWHKDKTKLSQISKNLAWKVQQETQEMVGDLIEKYTLQTGIKNVCIGGGYGLNCMANYYYKERFPELNIFNDPVSHDGGTAIGLAKYVWYNQSESKVKTPLTTLYLGPEESIDYSSLINLDETKYKKTEVTDSDVAQLLKDQNIIAYYQGRSEAGPRALGNRSILYTPLDTNGKDNVNVVKGREWFRPFAGSMLQEHFQDWFKTYGMEETPYMMYAMDFKDEKKDLVPSITHVDGTCRIQTVKEEQNKNFYNLINEFYKLTNVPILFNTSFNLAGDPLVETVDDAIDALDRSKIKFLYLPEVNILVEKLNNE